MLVKASLINVVSPRPCPSMLRSYVRSERYLTATRFFSGVCVRARSCVCCRIASISAFPQSHLRPCSTRAHTQNVCIYLYVYTHSPHQLLPSTRVSLFALPFTSAHTRHTQSAARTCMHITQASENTHTYTHLLPELLVELVLVRKARADGQRHGAARDKEKTRARSAQFGSERKGAR